MLWLSERQALCCGLETPGFYHVLWCSERQGSMLWPSERQALCCGLEMPRFYHVLWRSERQGSMLWPARFLFAMVLNVKHRSKFVALHPKKLLLLK
jgi:hypothetical protein